MTPEEEGKLDELIAMLDANLSAPPPSGLSLLIALLAKRVDEEELQLMMLG